MTTGIASGLGSTFGIALESTVGTFATPVGWLPHDKAVFQQKKHPAISQALRGSRFLLAQRRVVTSYTVDGTVELDLTDRQLGKIFTACVGGAVPSYTSLAAGFLGTWTPGLLEGVALSVQKGEPALPGGVIQAMSYSGVKVLDWTVSVQRDGLAKLALTCDGISESTTPGYTAPTYLVGANAPNVYAFNQAALLTGGAITFNTSTLSTTTGTAPTGVISSVNIKGTNKYKIDRFPLGSTTKKEQITNAFADITGDIEIEFATLADYYSAFVADTTVPLVLTFTGPTAIGSGIFPTLQIALAAAKFDEGQISEQGPDIITAKVPFTAYDDGSGNTVQIQYITKDSAA